jgi:hypothetical protein
LIKLDIIMGANYYNIIVIVPFHISISSSFFAILSAFSIKIDAIFKLSSMDHAMK